MKNTKVVTLPESPKRKVWVRLERLGRLKRTPLQADVITTRESFPCDTRNIIVTFETEKEIDEVF